MKGIRTFATQAQGLQYFTGRIIDAANRGWFETDAVKDLFQHEVKRWDVRSDNRVDGFWRLICLPILSFFRGVVEGGDSSMFCNFNWKVEVARTRGCTKPIVGSMTWRGQATDGRFIRLLFGSDGSCRMFYDTGYRCEEGEDMPKGPSSFLNLPAQGDEDRSAMERDEFLKLASAS